jgi:hypothetical protein
VPVHGASGGPVPHVLKALYADRGPDDALELRARAVPGDVDQELLVVRVGRADDRPCPAVAQLPLLEGLADLGQMDQGPRDAKLLPGGGQGKAATPGQPVRAGDDPDPCPPLPAVELGQHVQPATLRSGEVARESQQVGLELR